MSGDLLILGAEIDGAPGRDVRVAGGVITEIGAVLRGPEPVLQAGGGALLPGLIDHHIHLLALAAERASLRLGPADVAGPGGLAAALRERRSGCAARRLAARHRLSRECRRSAGPSRAGRARARRGRCASSTVPAASGS